MNQSVSENIGNDICAVIPAYNSAKFLAAAIESAIGQTHPFAEIIVVDDGSTDETKAVCERYYPQVSYIYQTNQGVSAARNTGFSNSNCELVVFLDSDDRLLSTAVEIGLNCLKEHPDAGFVFGDYLFQSINPDGSYTTQPRKYQPPAVASYATILAAEHQIQCATVLFRRTVLESVGGFDPSLTMMEDLNLFMRIAQQFPIYYHQQVVSEYRYNGNNVSSQSAKMLIGALQSQRRQWDYVSRADNPVELAAYAQGRQTWIKFFGERLPYEIVRCADASRWLAGLGHLRLLLNHDPDLEAIDPEIFGAAEAALMESLQVLPLAADLDYWRTNLAGAPRLLSLPDDRLRRPRASCYQQSPVMAIAPELTTLAQSQGVTLSTVLLGAFNVLLHRYSGATDICIGIPSTQQFEGKEWVNPLVIRTDLAGAPSFRAVLESVRQVTASADLHGGAPFELVVADLPPQRQSGYHPLFQVAFVFDPQPTSLDRLELAMTASDWVMTERAAKFDLVLAIEATSDGWVGSWSYNPDLFAAETIARLSGHFQILLAGIVANPEQPICQLPLLTAPERHQLLVEWNNTQTEYPQDKCIYQLFEEQVDRTPDAVAVVFEGQQLTYRELNNRANQLAHYLQKLGVKPDVPIGIWIERSLEMVVGVLGILKAGGAYVPLDPAYPQERLAYMLENSGVKLLLAIQQLVTKLPNHDIQVVCLDTDWDRIVGGASVQQHRENSSNLVSEVGLENLGYTIYTSGSTGQPKGVAMTQRALCNLIVWQISAPTVPVGGASPVENRAKTLQFAPISFDVSFQEMFSTWCAGGTLVLIADKFRRNPFALLELLEQQAIERLFLPFVALQQLAEVAVSSELFPQQLREVITAGEQLQITPAISKFFSNLSNCTLHNHYGPSESHVVTTFSLTTPVENWSALPPIGRPIANTQIYVLDSQMQPLPIGVSGEIYIGGDCLARGYFNRPDLTAERFILNPFSNDPNARLYKTGDLARYRPDGNIEYLGRIDNQVKIRGYRIELGEVESWLAQHPAVAQCSVIVREDNPGDKRLVAYCVAERARISGSELREFLAQQLPDYMLPAAVVILDVLPLTTNGKVDRQALLALRSEDVGVPITVPPSLVQLGDSPAVGSTPRNPTEELLIQIWKETLGRDRIGVNDNFFDLGGNSISILQVSNQIQSRLGNVEISVVKLFQYSTIARLGAYLDGIQTQPSQALRDKLQSRAQQQKAANARRRR